MVGPVDFINTWARKNEHCYGNMEYCFWNLIEIDYVKIASDINI